MRPIRPTPSRIPIVALLALLALAVAACDQGSSGSPLPTAPVDPAPPIAPLAGATWIGTWSFDEATPPEDCLADALNAYRGSMTRWRHDLKFEREGDRVRLRFVGTNGNDDSEGFWPLAFDGAIDAAGRVRATVPRALIGTLRTDPWMELCYWSWTMQGGHLVADLSPDGRSLSGSVVETFRAEGTPFDATFTIHSHFEASKP